jgi:hypothetical protein
VQGNVFRHRPLGDAIKHHDQEGNEEVKSAHYVVIAHWGLQDSKLQELRCVPGEPGRVARLERPIWGRRMVDAKSRDTR